MNAERPDMSTDQAWEEWGRRDPYFGVITDPRYRRSGMTDELKREFFQSGANHVRSLFETIRRYLDANFEPKNILDFGCGVGRLLVPFAAAAERVVGLDVSPAMLLEAKRNCEERQLHNVALMASDDVLSTLTETFDLIHSYIVFQHIPVQRGRTLFVELLKHLRPGGVGAIHLTYSKSSYASTHGLGPSPDRSPVPLDTLRPTSEDPEMQMNPYNINELLFSMQRLGFTRTHIEFTDHGGELGAFLFFSLDGSHIGSTGF